MRFVPSKRILALGCMLACAGAVSLASAANALAPMESFIGEGRVEPFSGRAIRSLESRMRADYAEFGSGGSFTQFNVRLGVECCAQEYETPPVDYVHTGFYKIRETHPWWHLYVWEQQYPATGGTGYDLGLHKDPANYHSWRIVQRWESEPDCEVGDQLIPSPCVQVEYDGVAAWATRWYWLGSSFLRGFAGGQTLAHGQDGWHFEGRTTSNRHNVSPYDGRPPGEKDPLDWVSTGSDSWRWDDVSY